MINQPGFVWYALRSGIQLRGKSAYREYGVHGLFVLQKVRDGLHLCLQVYKNVCSCWATEIPFALRKKASPIR